MTAVRISEAVREPFYTPKTLARLLQVSERTVRTMLAEPKPQIASFKIMGQRRVAAADLQRYLERHRSEAR